MNNIYVDELPKNCAECKFCEYYEEDVHGKGMHEVACCLNGFLTNALWGDQLEVKYCPHLKLITDRLAEERKKVVQEIKNAVEPAMAGYNPRWLETSETSFNRVLDQIERGE